MSTLRSRRSLVGRLRWISRIDDADRRRDLARDVGRIDADAVERLGIAAQQRSVVAADVEHAPVAAGHDRHGTLRDALEVIAHRVVHARAIPVVGIENFRRDGMGHLQEAAGLRIAGHVATHEQHRDISSAAAAGLGHDESALQILLTEIDDRREMRRAAYPAGLAALQMHARASPLLAHGARRSARRLHSCAWRGSRRCPRTAPATCRCRAA